MDPAPSDPNASHDIREFAYLARRHLTVVLGRIQMLRRDTVRGRTDLERCAARLDDIEISVRRLERLVDDLEGTRNRG